jgi:hypothetical protein
VKEVSEWANGTVEGNGMWKSEGVARHFKTAQYIYKIEEVQGMWKNCKVTSFVMCSFTE